MQEAARATFPDFRRYLRAKAALLGHDDGLPWCDLLAPVGDTGGPVPWETATSTVTDVFAGYSPALAGLARRAVDERWIDAAPHAGKEGGAYCMPVRTDESRVFLNFDGSWDGASTLAHELGHAYHNTTLALRTPRMAVARVARVRY